MTFKRITVKDFQSVADASIDLGVREGGGGITTIVGPSSTGKSATLRAVRMLARNGSTIPVRAGAKVTQVSVVLDDERTVSVERGPGKSSYAIGEEVYTKAGVTVPDEVAAVLGLRADAPDPHFSFQFDRPYLLAESGSLVSELLGKLTSANVLRAAVREGARRNLRAAQTHTGRMNDAKALATQIKDEYGGVDEQLETIERCRAVVQQAAVAAQQAEDYGQALEDLRAAQRGLEAVSEASARYEAVADAVQSATQTVKVYDTARKTWGKAVSAQQLLTSQEQLSQELQALAAERDAEHAALLAEAGTCPTCGQATA